MEPYPNLRKGQIRVKPSNDKPLDLPELVRVLEGEVGFAPVTEVEIELRGRLAKRGGRLSLEVPETGQSFEISRKPKGESPAEGQLVDVRGTLEEVRSARRLKLLEWKPAASASSQP